MRGGWVSSRSVTFFFNMIGLAALLIAAPAFAKDPTQPPAGRVAASDAPAEAAEPLRLQAIVRGPARVAAVINGQTLKVGDRIGDARVLAVRPHSVVIDREGQRQELRLSTPILQMSRTQP